MYKLAIAASSTMANISSSSAQAAYAVVSGSCSILRQIEPPCERGQAIMTNRVDQPTG